MKGRAYLYYSNHSQIMPLISILMPVYNAAPYLEECWQSITQQSCTDWELIAVNDGSTDHSADLLHQFAQADSRLRVLDNPQKGIIPALRLAYANSQGRFITRMDADDRMTAQKLELMQKKLRGVGPGHICTAEVAYFSAEPLGNGYARYAEWLNTLTRRAANFSECYRECVIPSPCWMCYREDFEACGAFNSDIYPEDYDLCFRFYAHGLKVTSVPQVLHYWRDYAERTSRNDPNYANPYFLDIKVDYFLKIDYRSEGPLVLWGAGKKGKHLARRLVDGQIPFQWITNNEKKIGHRIYDQLLETPKALDLAGLPQIIISLGNPEERNHLLHELQNHQLQLGHHLFPFA